MSCQVARDTVRLIGLFVLVLAAIAWSACGVNSQSSFSNSNPTTSNNPTTSSSQPGSSGASSGSSSGGGTSGSGGNGGSGAAGGTYLYVGVSSDTAAIRGYKVDTTAATLSEVSGSPFTTQGSGNGQMAVTKNFVYTTSFNRSDGSSIITELRADSGTGTLTQVGTTSVKINGAVSNGQFAVYTESTDRNLYALSATGDVVTFTFNSDGTLTEGGTIHLADGVGSMALSPNGQLAYVTISNGSFKAGTLTDGTVVLNRDAATGTLSKNRQLNSNQHLFNLKFDTSGRYLLAASGAADHISVYSVNYSTGDLTAVAGSPFATVKTAPPNAPSDFIRTFSLDPASKFVYVLDANGADPKPEYVQVFSFTEATGNLASAQSFDMTPGTNPVSIVADQSLLYVVNTNSGFNPSNINVFRRDANTGMLSAGGSPTTVSGALGGAAELRF